MPPPARPTRSSSIARCTRTPSKRLARSPNAGDRCFRTRRRRLSKWPPRRFPLRNRSLRLPPCPTPRRSCWFSLGIIAVGLRRVLDLASLLSRGRARGAIGRRPTSSRRLRHRLLRHARHRLVRDDDVALPPLRTVADRRCRARSTSGTRCRRSRRRSSTSTIVEVESTTLIAHDRRRGRGRAGSARRSSRRWPRRDDADRHGRSRCSSLCACSSTASLGDPTAATRSGSTARCSSLGVAGNFVLGALMTIGVGLYAPCMVLVSCSA